MATLLLYIRLYKALPTDAARGARRRDMLQRPGRFRRRPYAGIFPCHFTFYAIGLMHRSSAAGFIHPQALFHYPSHAYRLMAYMKRHALYSSINKGVARYDL